MTALDLILAHLATSDAAARAATPGEWVKEPRMINSITIKGGRIEVYPDCRMDDWGDKDVRDALEASALHIATHSPAAILRMNAVVRELAEAVEAANRIDTNDYVDWPLAGDINECAHGYSEGIPCWKCDREKVASALQRAAERLQPAPAGKEAR